MTASTSACSAPIPRCDQRTAVRFIDDVMANCRSPSNGCKPTMAQNSASFRWHLLDKGIDHMKIKPRTPRLNGKDPTGSTLKSSTGSSKAK